MTQELYQHIQSLQHYMETLSEQEQELARSLEAIEELEKAGKGTEIMIPISKGVFIKASVLEKDNFLIGVGSQVVSAKNGLEAKELLSERLEELEKVREELSQQFTESYQELISQQLQQEQKEED